jgi:hypothetical protein
VMAPFGLGCHVDLRSGCFDRQPAAAGRQLQA